MQYLDLDLVGDGIELRGMLDAPPGNIGDVQQAVQAAEVDEDAVLGDVFDGPGHDFAFLNRTEGLGALGLALFFQQNPPRKHDVAAFAIVFEDPEGEAFAHQLIQIADGAQVGLGTRQKRLDADVHRKAALDPVGDDPLDRAVVVVAGFDGIPDLDLGGLFLGQDDALLFVIPVFHHHLDFVVELGVDFAVLVAEFLDANLAFGLVADVHQNVILVDGDDPAGDDLAFPEALDALLVHLHQVFHGFFGRGAVGIDFRFGIESRFGIDGCFGQRRVAGRDGVRLCGFLQLLRLFRIVFC